MPKGKGVKMLIVNKERKGKGLLYLIAIAVLIAVISAGCKNKPTQTNDFAGFDENVQGIQANESLTTLLGKTIRSRNPITEPSYYLWAKFTEDGISYGIGDSVNPTFNTALTASANAFNNFKATFSGTINNNKQSGDITIEVVDGLIKNVKVKFTEGNSYVDKGDISCQFVNQ